VSLWLREPLVHFLLAGALLFGAYAWLNRSGGEAPRVVRISAAEVNWLKETWSRQWSRAPSEQELRGLVADYLKEVLLAREAKSLGLDTNDTIVRRRLAQKMEFLVQDTARLAEPREDELRRLYDAERGRFQSPARLTFMQVYFKNEAGARRGMQEIVKRNPAELGDPSLIEREYARADAQEVGAVFGPDFAGKVFALDPGRWHGPLASSYGFHLVRVNERQAVEPRPYGEVRDQLLEEWHRTAQARAREQFFAGLLKKYDVVVDASVQPLIGPLAEAVR